ncbi:hypothetical protein LOK49_LG07G02171 [Camellia lanceoleosa]|uniref:Uncharacterized protein n=1 Tax=Camellia lanceoleosa TaxID=1840588 RepID=A0ACC0H6J0_9ERIC|nr:hypothetical protein LOK49_LG07G02171 [Camellia lanceoleosa]
MSEVRLFGATTNSQDGVTDLFGKCLPVLEEMVKHNMPLLETSTSCKGTNTKEGEEEVHSNVNGVLQAVAESKREVDDDDKDAELEDDVASKNEKAKDVSTPRLKERSELGVGDSCLQPSVVKETEERMGNSNEQDYGMGDTMMEEESVQQQQMQRCNHELGKVDVIQKGKGQVSSQGFVRSVTETQKGRPGVCLEVDLGHNQSRSQPNVSIQYKTQGNGLSHPMVSTEGGHGRLGCKSKCSDSISVSSGGSISNLIKQGPTKVIRQGRNKYPLVASGFNGLARRIGQRGVGAGRGRAHQTTMFCPRSAEAMVVGGMSSCRCVLLRQWSYSWVAVIVGCICSVLVSLLCYSEVAAAILVCIFIAMCFEVCICLKYAAILVCMFIAMCFEDCVLKYASVLKYAALLVHGEVTDPEVDIFDHERILLGLSSLAVKDSQQPATPQHLVLNRNSFFKEDCSHTILAFDY